MYAGGRRRVICGTTTAGLEATTLPANEEVVLDGIAGSALELVLEIDPGGAPMVELNVLRSPGREEYTRIAFYKDRGFRIQPDSPSPGRCFMAGGLPSNPLAVRGPRMFAKAC